MHRKIPVPTLLYNCLYPRPASGDPANFSAHLSRFLIPEIRVETALYYGDLSTVESRYPGLDYTFGPHIRRLSRFPHHARLFRAVRALGITNTELLDLARWEGTLWARQRYEKDEGIKVLDTTGDDIPQWSDPRKTNKPSSKIVATTTTTLVSSPATLFADTPAPRTSTPCELEVREVSAGVPADAVLPEDDDPSSSEDDMPDTQSENGLAASNIYVSSDAEASAGASDPRAVTSTTQTGPSELSRLLLNATLQSQSEDRPQMPLEQRVVMLLAEILRLNRALSAEEFASIRQYILRHVDELQSHVSPTSSVNIATAVTVMLEQQGQIPARASEALSQTQAAQAVPQPAA
ncbi:hypothetical protein ANO11243_087510 [Dothideomycetidae sp. 11243]|nr:hypothetical protein ANO11243_087510 [fungal sp. No.11243]